MAHLTPDVVIVGAGVAGLRAGVHLAREGRRVVVLEARSRLGGRATAFVDRDTGDRVDNGQHVLFGCYRETRAFLRESRAEALVHLQPRLDVAMVDFEGRLTHLRAANLPPPWHLLAGAWRWPALMLRDRLSLLRVASSLSRVTRRQRRLTASGGTVAVAADLAAAPLGEVAMPPSDHGSETVADWLARHGQTRRLVEMFWEPLALAALNQPSAAASVEPFLRVIGALFAGTSRDDAALLLPIKPLDEVFGIPARDVIEAHGGEVITGAAAIVDVTGTQTTVSVGGTTWQPRAVIVAAPWFKWREVFTGEVHRLGDLLTRASATSPSPIVTVHIWWDGPVVSDAVVGLPGRAFQWLFDNGRIWGAAASHVSLVSSGAKELLEWSNERIVATALQDLRDALPAARAAEPLRTTVVREPRATFSLAPGQPRRPSVQTVVPGVFVSGDWIETGLPATIEGAALAGRWAAEAASRYLGS